MCKHGEIYSFCLGCQTECQWEIEILFPRSHFPLLTFHFSLIFSSCFSLFTSRFSLLASRFSLLTFHFSLLTFHFSLLVFHFSLLTFHFSLLNLEEEFCARRKSLFTWASHTHKNIQSYIPFFSCFRHFWHLDRFLNYWSSLLILFQSNKMIQ